MMTWADFKLKFSKYHVPPGLIKKMRDEFRELKQGRMSVVEYGDRFLTLSRYAPDETDTTEKRKERFINGLHDEMQTVLVNIPFADLEALVDSAIQMEGKLHQANENRKRRMMHQSGPSNTPRAPNNNNNTSTSPRTGSNAIPVATKDKVTITCYECGVVGHYSNECPKRLAKLAGNTAAPAQQQCCVSTGKKFVPNNPNNRGGRLYHMNAEEAQEAPDVVLGTREEGFTQRPSGREDGTRRRHRVGVGQTDRDFSRPSQPCPERSIVLHQTHRPPTCATTTIGTPPPSNRDHEPKPEGPRRIPKPRNGEVLDTQEGTTSTASGGTSPDMLTRGIPGPPSPAKHRPTWPVLVKPPSGCCRTRAATTTMLSSGHLPCPPEAAAPLGTGPSRPRWGPKGPDLGRKGTTRRCLAAPPPTGDATISSPPGAAQPKEPRRRRNRRRSREHRRRPREPRAPPPYARVGASPPPPAPHGALPGGLRRRRRQGRTEERGGRGWVPRGPPVTRGERQRGPGRRGGEEGRGRRRERAWRRRRRRAGTLGVGFLLFGVRGQN
ncbi:hypothetical protein QYE76_004010 [Lolium multiflorum]|uniref:CCHC-type domain-containing protein n=1 Tax=Lolium multiflorum TaxID=4521 RepID=A0AAD8RRE8_LOLMU|nr:hypothetical protein QYE76_004010 [Lolium multiflorum]